MTFGETLEKYMKTNKITIDRLRASMGLKSNTSITRIIKDELSYKKIDEFYTKFITINPFRLVEYEKKQFVAALEVSRLGKETYAANSEMMYFLTKKPSPKPFVCARSYGAPGAGPGSVAELFKSYGACDDVRICMINCVYDDVIAGLIDCMKGRGGVRVEHYIPNEEGVVKDVQNFISILPIINFPNYNCYRARFTHYNESEILNRFNNIIIALRKINCADLRGGAGARTSVDFVSLKNDNEFTCARDCEDPGMYDFFSDLFDNMKLQHNMMKESLNNSNVMESLLGVADTMLSLEQSWDQALIKPNFCFNALSAEALGALFDGWESDAAARHIFEVQKQRHEIYCKKNKRHIGVYTAQGIADFLRTGRLSDHASVLRPFTGPESAEVLKKVISICEENPLNQIYLLKGNINYNNFQYSFFGRGLLYFCDQSTDYNGMNYSYITNSDKVVSVFYDFVMNELIPKHCLTAAESLETMKRMLQ